MITLIDLNYSKNTKGYISHVLEKEIQNTLNKNQKVLLYFNKRGAGKIFMCQQCQYMGQCPQCDVKLTIHTTPKNRLLCHHCEYEKEFQNLCPECGSSSCTIQGTGIQKSETDIQQLFANTHVLRIDSDTPQKEYTSLLNEAQIILGTQKINAYEIEHLGLVAFLLIEGDMLVPEYTIEEQIYTNIAMNMKRNTHVMVQTYTPHLPIIDHIINGNYRSFLQYTLKERQQFSYPPYGQLVYIWVTHKKKEKIQSLIFTLVNKIRILIEGATETYEMFFDKQLFVRRAGEYKQKIILKGTNLAPLLSQIQEEIIRNKEMELEWK